MPLNFWHSKTPFKHHHGTKTNAFFLSFTFILFKAQNQTHSREKYFSQFFALTNDGFFPTAVIAAAASSEMERTIETDKRRNEKSANGGIGGYR